MKAFSVWRSVMLGLLLVWGATAQAAVSCNVTAQNVGELYPSSGFNSVSGDLRISCTRTLLSDPATVYYSIKADYGLNSPSVPLRKVLRPAGTTLFWVLQRGAVGQGSPTNWGTTALAGLLTGSLSFAPTALATSTTISNAYTMRIQRGGGNPNSPAPGAYTDTVTLTPEMSTTAEIGPYNVTALTTQVNFTVGVPSVCVVRKPGQNLTFNYSSFTSTPLTQTSNFEALCSDTVNYTVAVSPVTGTIAGINYTVALEGSPTRISNGNPVIAAIKVDLASGQSGTCATAVCSGSATHTVTITY